MYKILFVYPTAGPIWFNRSCHWAWSRIKHTGRLLIVFERDWKTYPWEKSNKCRLKRDHFKRKILSPSIILQGVYIYISGEYSFTAYCVIFILFLQYFCFVLHFHMYQLPIWSGCFAFRLWVLQGSSHTHLILGWHDGCHNLLFKIECLFPSKIEWDRIPTDPVQ